MNRLYQSSLVACALLASTSVATCNDTAAELSIGGLQFIHAETVAMDSEDLKISLERVNVRYQFTNTSTKPVSLTVAFPLPDIDLNEGESIAFPSNDPLNFVDFETKIDGKPIKLGIEQRAFVGEKDVTPLLKQLKVALLPIGAQQFRPQDLSEPAKAKMLSEGLLMPAGTNDRGRPLYSAGWVVKTSVFRDQTFPAGVSVAVEHSYRPSVGASYDTILRKAIRQSKGMASELERYRRDYCVTDEFLQRLDKMAGTSPANTAMIQERRISYVLKTGANWAGPIKNFHLVIDPGGNDRLVSYCAGRLNPGFTTPLEVSAANFVPDRDLKVLIVGRF